VIEPVTVTTPRAVRAPVLTQGWRELAFLHWAVPPAAVAPLLPPGTEPDVLDGVSYVGLIGFRMVGVGLFGVPVPYFGTFCETNVRLYSVDGQGRRGVVFRSLEAARLAPTLTARAALNLPYTWARMRLERDGEVRTYTSRRRWPAPRGAATRFAVRIGAPLDAPGPLEHFLTARWGLHVRAWGGTRYLANEHPPWPLHRAELLHLQDDLVATAGLPGLASGPPASVLWSPGVPVRFGPTRGDEPRPSRRSAFTTGC
jgi:uncharacterized protein YqjF (DUF2071 family)